MSGQEWLDVAALLVVAVVVIGAATAVALRRTPPHRDGVRRGAGIWASIVTWSAVLLAVALAVRGRWLYAVVLLAAAVVHAVVIRARSGGGRALR